MSPRLIGSVKWPDGYLRHPEPGGAWGVYIVHGARLPPTADRRLGRLEAIFTGRLARLRSWVYVTFATVRD